MTRCSVLARFNNFDQTFFFVCLFLWGGGGGGVGGVGGGCEEGGRGC